MVYFILLTAFEKIYNSKCKNRIIQNVKLPVAENLHFRSVVKPWNWLHQVACRVISEVGWDVSYSDSTVGGQVTAKLVHVPMKYANLFDAKLCVSVCNGFPELVTQRVKHRVMWMDRRKSILVQLIRDNIDQCLHASRVIGPVTNDLNG